MAPLGDRAHQPDPQSRRDLFLDRGPIARRARRRAGRGASRRGSRHEGARVGGDRPDRRRHGDSRIDHRAGCAGGDRGRAEDRGGQETGRDAARARAARVRSGAARVGVGPHRARPDTRRRAVPVETVSPRRARRGDGDGVQVERARRAGRRPPRGAARATGILEPVDCRRVEQRQRGRAIRRRRERTVAADRSGLEDGDADGGAAHPGCRPVFEAAGDLRDRRGAGGRVRRTSRPRAAGGGDLGAGAYRERARRRRLRLRHAARGDRAGVRRSLLLDHRRRSRARRAERQGDARRRAGVRRR